MTDIFIGTILLEKNRWSQEKQPTYQVSEWLERFQADGFSGMELWENHAALAGADEVSRLANAAFPVAVFNSYCTFDAAGRENRERAAQLAKRLNAQAVKFNLGGQPEQQAEYVENAAAWRNILPDGIRLLCECHAGTIMQTPEKAQEIFAIWGDHQFQAIVHPFTTPHDELRRWFTCLGSRITHAHVQIRDQNGAMRGLGYNQALVTETLHIMREEGFQGSFTLEFTEGTRQPDENIAGLYAAALQDLQLLRSLLP